MTDWGAAAAPVIPVSLLVSSARLLIERHLGLAWIRGEVSNYSRAASGHVYFVLKDEQAQVRCVLFRQKAQFLEFALKDGQQVEVRAVPTIYEARGEFQLNVETVRLAGLGALYEQFAKLKARLEAAGWFAAERKRPLPAFPRAVGIVTSLRAAALSDVLTTLKRRMPTLPVIVYPASVQGAGAAGEIAAAIAAANAHDRVDVLIVCRGGGSIEDLWAFNEEVVARAVFASRLPIVSGVGHETDFTICDFVADARAPTPTGAAALVAPDGRVLRSKLAELAARSRRIAQHVLEIRMQRLDGATRRLVHPAARLEAQGERLRVLALRLTRAAMAGNIHRRRDLALSGERLARLARTPLPQRVALERAHTRWQRAGAERVAALAYRLAALASALRHLSPQGVLERGYSIVTTEAGAIVHDAAQVTAGDTVSLRFARGGADALVTRTRRS
ncbi:MAG TPA: exodeoxyribonuclease VII large subunit [Casimicrobiaceae bacterium]